MTTEQEWFDIPYYSRYQANREGQVRYKQERGPYPGGSRMVRRDKYHSGLRDYHLRNDNLSNFESLSPSWVLFLVFGIEDLSLLEHCKDYGFEEKKRLYGFFQYIEVVIDKLLSDDYSSSWNEFFGEIKPFNSRDEYDAYCKKIVDHWCTSIILRDELSYDSDTRTSNITERYAILSTSNELGDIMSNYIDEYGEELEGEIDDLVKALQTYIKTEEVQLNSELFQEVNQAIDDLNTYYTKHNCDVRVRLELNYNN